MNKVKYIMLGIIAILFLSGCADAVNYDLSSYREPVGFWYGLWHGIITPFSFIGSLFSEDIAVYAIYNNGAWYNFGFLLGCGALFGGSSRN